MTNDIYSGFSTAMNGRSLYNFSTNSNKGSAIFHPEIRNVNGSEILWSGQTLRNSNGKLINETFFLPEGLVNKPVEFRLYIITQEPGEHYFKIKNIAIS